MRLNIRFTYGFIHKVRHTNFVIFNPSPVLVTVVHLYETLPNVTSHILQFLQNIKNEITTKRGASGQHSSKSRCY